MIVRTVTVHWIADAGHDGLIARRLIVVDAATGKREQLWPEAARPVLSVPIPTVPSHTAAP